MSGAFANCTLLAGTNGTQYVEPTTGIIKDIPEADRNINAQSKYNWYFDHAFLNTTILSEPIENFKKIAFIVCGSGWGSTIESYYREIDVQAFMTLVHNVYHRWKSQYDSATSCINMTCIYLASTENEFAIINPYSIIKEGTRAMFHNFYEATNKGINGAWFTLLGIDRVSSN